MLCLLPHPRFGFEFEVRFVVLFYFILFYFFWLLLSPSLHRRRGRQQIERRRQRGENCEFRVTKNRKYALEKNWVGAAAFSAPAAAAAEGGGGGGGYCGGCPPPCKFPVFFAFFFSLIISGSCWACLLFRGVETGNEGRGIQATLPSALLSLSLSLSTTTKISNYRGEKYTERAQQEGQAVCICIHAADTASG